MAKIISTHCVYPCPDIEKTAEFYSEKLGFHAVAYLDIAEPHICLYRDTIEIILIKSNGQRFIPNREQYGYGYDGYFITTQ